jgi:Protein of unknown function (DUF3106)
VKRSILSLVVAVALMIPLSSAVEAGPRHHMASWRQLTPQQQTILQPIRQNWDHLPYKQRERLLGLVGHYPKMSAIEKQRFEARLPQWAGLTRVERDLTRRRYLAFSKLPKGRKVEYKKQWQEQHTQLSGEYSTGL